MRTILLLMLMSISQIVISSDILFETQSQYSQIIVREQKGVRCLQFASAPTKQQFYQGCISTKNHTMMFNYSKALMAALFLKREPKTVLVIGLGAGVVPKALHFLHPEALIDIVEIDPIVVEVAHTYFGFPESDRIQVAVEDGRVFVNQALEKGHQYDVVILDAFGSEYIPEHLMTQEFLQDVRTLMTEDGAFSANTFSKSALYHHESMTYQSVFGNFYNIKLDGDRANRVLVGSRDGLLPIPMVQDNAKYYYRVLNELFDIDTASMLPMMEMEPNWDQTAQVLTDQYSPANALNGEAILQSTLIQKIDQAIVRHPGKTAVALIGFLIGAFGLYWLFNRLMMKKRRIEV